MPTQEECTAIKVTQAQQDARMSAMSERLDEVLDELRALRKWLSSYGTVILLVAIFGEKAMPIVTKIFGVQ